MAKKNHFACNTRVFNAVSKHPHYLSELIKTFEIAAADYMKGIFIVKDLEWMNDIGHRLDKMEIDSGLCNYLNHSENVSSIDTHFEKGVIRSVCDSTYYCHAWINLFASERNSKNAIFMCLEPRLQLCFSIIEECWRLIVQENKKDFPNPLSDKQTKELLNSYSKLMTQVERRKDANAFVNGYMEMNWFTSMEIQAAFLFGDKDNEHWGEVRDKFRSALQFANIEFKDMTRFDDEKLNMLHVKHSIRMQGIFLTELLNK